MPRNTDVLSPDRGLIFRITHVQNVRWILSNGLHCASSDVRDSEFVSIGNEDLINRRRSRPVPIAPFGTLADYVPFYFTPFSPMFYNVHTGYGGITRRKNTEIVMLVSSLARLEQSGTEFLLTDRHAVLETATFFPSRSSLAEVIDYGLLRRKDFRLDPEDPEKLEKYQAEALVYKHMDVSALVGIACDSETIRMAIAEIAAEQGHSIHVRVREEWYFR